MASGTLTFRGRTGGNDSLRRIQLQLLDDTQLEPVETVMIRLTSPVNAFLGPRDTYTHTIRASDAPMVPWAVLLVETA